MIMNKSSVMKAEMYGQVKREKMLETGRILSDLSLSSVASFLEKVKDVTTLFLDDCTLCSCLNQC